MTTSTVDVTVMLPAYNEADNLPTVVKGICDMLRARRQTFEVLVVDDGSTDGTPDAIRSLQADHPELRGLRIRRNGGKSAALRVGFGAVRGEVVVLMDADGQDDPAEVPRLIDELDNGVDLVTGRRSVRQDRFIKRNTSKLYNWTTAKVSGVPGHDFNSGLKAMRREVADSLDMYGELHRYIPVLAHWDGFSVAEMDVEHHPRLHGSSKFGRSRFWRGFLDLFTVKFLVTYTARPFHLFGGIGIASTAFGAVLLSWMFVLRIAGERIGDRPALVIGVLLVVVGIQLMSLGLLAELIIHYRSHHRDVSVSEID